MKKSLLFLSALLFSFVLGVSGLARAEEAAKAPPPAAGAECPHMKKGEGGEKVECPYAKGGGDGKMKCPHAKNGEMKGEGGDCPCKHEGAMKDCAKDCPHKAKGDCPCAKGGDVPADCPCHGKGDKAKGEKMGKGKGKGTEKKEGAK